MYVLKKMDSEAVFGKLFLKNTTIIERLLNRQYEVDASCRASKSLDALVVIKEPSHVLNDECILAIPR